MECPQCASLDMHVIVYREREATTRHCVCPDCRFEMWDEYGPWRIQPAPLDAPDARVNPDCTIRGVTR